MSVYSQHDIRRKIRVKLPMLDYHGREDTWLLGLFGDFVNSQGTPFFTLFAAEAPRRYRNENRDEMPCGVKENKRTSVFGKPMANANVVLSIRWLRVRVPSPSLTCGKDLRQASSPVKVPVPPISLIAMPNARLTRRTTGSAWIRCLQRRAVSDGTAFFSPASPRNPSRSKLD